MIILTPGEVSGHECGCEDRIMIICNFPFDPFSSLFLLDILLYKLVMPTAVWVCISAFISMKPPQLSNIHTDHFENFLWWQKADVFDRRLGNRKSRASPSFQRDLGTCSCVSCDQNRFFKAKPGSFLKPNQVFFCAYTSALLLNVLYIYLQNILFFLFLSKTKHSVPSGACCNSPFNTYILTFITNMWNNYFIFFLIHVSLTHMWFINLSLCTFLLNLCPANTCIYFLLWLTTRQTKDEPLTPNF